MQIKEFYFVLEIYIANRILNYLYERICIREKKTKQKSLIHENYNVNIKYQFKITI